MPAVASLDGASPTTVILNLGQSRRIHLDHDATTVLVASPEVADVRLLAPDVLYVIGKGVGRTSVAMLDDEERIEERVVSVGLDLEPLRSVLAGESDLRDVRAKRLSRGVALTGEVASAASVDRALRLAAGTLPEGVPIENDLRLAAPQQVNLEVQIAEVHRSVTEDLGVSWEAFRGRGDKRFGFRIGRVIDHTFPPTLAEGRVSTSVFFGRETENSRITAMIDALATAGLANVLARPNVTAVSGESASFFSGGERPIPTGYDSRTETILFEYKKVGVLLDFVPTVVDTGRIVLTVRPEVSEPDASQPLAIGPVTLPVINVRRAETTVEVGDGGSIVIAGLFSNRSSTTESGLPGLKDVPLLGLLFGTNSIRSDELELIVFVTARLVQAREAPGDTGAPAADTAGERLSLLTFANRPRGTRRLQLLPERPMLSLPSFPSPFASRRGDVARGARHRMHASAGRSARILLAGEQKRRQNRHADTARDQSSPRLARGPACLQADRCGRRFAGSDQRCARTELRALPRPPAKRWPSCAPPSDDRRRRRTAQRRTRTGDGSRMGSASCPRRRRPPLGRRRLLSREEPSCRP